jgi:hypothetical protein
MGKQIWAAVISLLLSIDALGNEQVETPHKKVTGVYRIYGGGLGDPIPPSPKDTKIMFSLSGSAAKEMFNALGPDMKDICTEGTGLRVRKKDNEKMWCSKSADGEYSCNFGFDLRTGKSIGGIVC